MEKLDKRRKEVSKSNMIQISAILNEIKKKFPESYCSMKVVPDQKLFDEWHLYIYVNTKLSEEDAEQRLEEFNKEYWHALIYNAKKNVEVRINYTERVGNA